MEMTIASTFSANGLLGHLSYVLLILSMLNTRMIILRLGVIGSALTGIIYSAFFVIDPVSVFWETMLMLVNAMQVLRHLLADRMIGFEGEEADLRKSVLADLSNVDARKLIDIGFWVTGQQGEELIREETAVSHLFYLASGEAEVSSGGQVVGRCGPGDLIGEGTILTSNLASGTVVVSKKSRLWCIPAPQLAAHLEDNPPVRSVLERRIGDALKAKLRASNTVVSALGGARTG